MNENQPSRKNLKARDGICVDEANPSAPDTGSSAPIVPAFSSSKERGNEKWCPTAIYQGILTIPVCSTYDVEFQSSDLVDLTSGLPLSSTGLKNIPQCQLCMSQLTKAAHSLYVIFFSWTIFHNGKYYA